MQVDRVAPLSDLKCCGVGSGYGPRAFQPAGQTTNGKMLPEAELFPRRL